ncbi:SDR family NAD(P)-dependent oxidoreductase [Pinisolibacter aquiterrae]|uniref:SDR family NAD(P)-dependent oxidoreductase n=1 Tax=Pinisolibacter aquiterrae TaxID=2815579 RepID=UPI001C3E76BF|nr:SDR family NAD(P)-dependent oxidoreductase [Pinisolibacter aquiterrae]MBV5264735.1 SDR family NAD(P)-dependent oxidoreductase [Pinisolibacter aquiterrae]MCC8233504.1 SDR family NAD(P)-dependent oxidoreductase [Pinisolibacter aquiterrae]
MTGPTGTGPRARRSILITGASSGIGRAAAEMLAARGWRVFATARNGADLDDLGRLPGVEPVFLELADAASIEACARTVLAATGGRLDALFNNGAYGQLGAVEDLRTEVLRAQFEVNVFGWHDLTRRLIPALRATGQGRIVQCSSVLGIVAMKYRGAYTASKFALEGLSDTLRMELRGSGVEVVTIRPGPIATRFVAHAIEALEAHVDMAASVHAPVYRRRLERLRRGGASQFKLPPSAVVEKLIAALDAERPRATYAVTVPTVIMAWARRLLSDTTLSKWAGRLSDRE